MENKLILVDGKIKDISTKLIEYLDFKDSIFENEFVESFGDSFKLVKLLKTGHDLISRRKFNAFLKGFCYDDTPTEEQLSKLNKYIDNEGKAEFIADMFSKALLSKSKLSNMVMGILLGDLINTRDNISIYHLLCADALEVFYDIDVKCFHQMVEYMKIEEKSFSEKFWGHKHSFIKNLDYEHFNKYGMFASNITIRKSLQNDLIALDNREKDYDGNEKGIYKTYYLTEAGELFYTYIDKISSYLD